MEVYIGKIVNTPGIKGEVRIISDFKYKNLVFKPEFNIYVGKKREKLTIATYRTHKNYDMVMVEGINDINQALLYKGESVYINREDLKMMKSSAMIVSCNDAFFLAKNAFFVD